MITLTWRKDGEHYVGHVSSEVLWRIDKVWSPNPKGYGWYVSGLEDIGYYEALNTAKNHCQRRTQEALEKRERAIR